MPKGLKHWENTTLKEVITHMCEMISVDPDTIDFREHDWYMHHSWSEEKQDAFKQWLMKWLPADKKRLGDIAAFPSIAKHNKKQLEKLVNEIILQYGFKVDYGNKEEKQEERKL